MKRDAAIRCHLPWFHHLCLLLFQLSSYLHYYLCLGRKIKRVTNQEENAYECLVLVSLFVLDTILPLFGLFFLLLCRIKALCICQVVNGDGQEDI